jgi:hypothetical protein
LSTQEHQIKVRTIGDLRKELGGDFTRQSFVAGEVYLKPPLPTGSSKLTEQEVAGSRSDAGANAEQGNKGSTE